MSYLDFYKYIIGLLNNGHLLDALLAIQKEATTADTDSRAALLTTCSDILDTYRSLLSYFERGVEDKGRNTVYADLVLRTCQLNEQLKRARGLKESTNIYYGKLRTQLRSPHNLTYYTQRIEQHRTQQLMGDIFRDASAAYPGQDNGLEALETGLFDYIWVADRFSSEELTALQAFLTPGNGENDNLQSSCCEAAWMVGALTLSVLYYFDIDKWLLLRRLAGSDVTRVRVRASVGCALVMMYHKELFSLLRIINSYDPASNERISRVLQPFWSDNIEYACNLQWLFMVEYKTKFIRSTLNDTLNSLIRNLGKELSQEQIQNMLEDEDSDLPAGVNPETIRHLREEIRHTTNMTVEGIDTAYPQFLRIRRLPFFNEVSNWLRPLDAADAPDLKRAQALSLILSNSRLCSSDAFAFIHAINVIPPSMREFISNQLKALDGASKPISELVDNFSEQDLAIFYIRDIYRLFTIKFQNQIEANPLTTEPLMLFITNLYDDTIPDNYLSGGDFASLCTKAFDHRLYNHAVRLFSVLDSKDNNTDSAANVSMDANRQAMYAVSLSLTNHNKEALAHFRSVKDTLPEGFASVYAYTLWAEGHRENALEIFLSLFDFGWSGLNLLDIGRKLFSTKRYDNAATVLYKAYYLDDTNVEVMDLLMMTQLHLHKTDEAQNICNKLGGMNLPAGDNVGTGSVRSHENGTAGQAEGSVPKRKFDASSNASRPFSVIKDMALCCLCTGMQETAVAYLRLWGISETNDSLQNAFSASDRRLLSSYGIDTLRVNLVIDAAHI